MARAVSIANESRVQMIDLGARLRREEEGTNRDRCTRKKMGKIRGSDS